VTRRGPPPPPLPPAPAPPAPRRIANHEAPGIDFATVHAWPDRWGVGEDPGGGFTAEWLERHLRVAGERLRMPVVLEEFGHPVRDWGDAEEECDGGFWNAVVDGMVSLTLLTESFRTHCRRRLPAAGLAATRRLVAATYGAVEASVLGPGGPGARAAGSQVWRVDARAEAGYTPASFDVNPYDGDVWALVEAHAAALHRLSFSGAPAAGLPCWVGQERGGMRSCVRRAEPCEAAREEEAARARGDAPPPGTARERREELALRRLTFTSWGACCAPGLGAHPDGCSLGSRVFYR